MPHENRSCFGSDKVGSLCSEDSRRGDGSRVPETFRPFQLKGVVGPTESKDIRSCPRGRSETWNPHPISVKVEDLESEEETFCPCLGWPFWHPLQVSAYGTGSGRTLTH